MVLCSSLRRYLLKRVKDRSVSISNETDVQLWLFLFHQNPTRTLFPGDAPAPSFTGHVYSFDRDASEAEHCQLVRQADVCLTGWNADSLDALLAQVLACVCSRILAARGPFPQCLSLAGNMAYRFPTRMRSGQKECGIYGDAALLCVRQAWVFDHLLKEGKLWSGHRAKLLRTQRVGIGVSGVLDAR